MVKPYLNVCTHCKNKFEAISRADRVCMSCRKKYNMYNFNFKNGISKIVLKRDKYMCQCCKRKGGDIKLNIHHIDLKRRNDNLNNLITLCEQCHHSLHSKFNNNNRKIAIQKFSKASLIRLVKSKFYPKVDYELLGVRLNYNNKQENKFLALSLGYLLTKYNKLMSVVKLKL